MGAAADPAGMSTGKSLGKVARPRPKPKTEPKMAPTTRPAVRCFIQTLNDVAPAGQAAVPRLGRAVYQTGRRRDLRARTSLQPQTQVLDIQVLLDPVP